MLFIFVNIPVFFYVSKKLTYALRCGNGKYLGATSLCQVDAIRNVLRSRSFFFKCSDLGSIPAPLEKIDKIPIVIKFENYPRVCCKKPDNSIFIACYRMFGFVAILLWIYKF